MSEKKHIWRMSSGSTYECPNCKWARQSIDAIGRHCDNSVAARHEYRHPLVSYAKKREPPCGRPVIKTRRSEDVVRKRLGNNLRRARVAMGLSRFELARRVGWAAKTSLDNIEAGTQGVHVETLIRLAGVLGVSPASLLPKVTANAARVAKP
jgi:ribosome-binding protein aMBF1 (putative translation factor)